MDVAPGQASFTIRRATRAESEFVKDLRLASLLWLEMPGGPLEAIGALTTRLPDLDAELVGSGQYFVAESGGDLIGGLGWSVTPVAFRPGRIVNEDFRPADLSFDPGSVLVRGFFLDPDLGRHSAASRLLAHVEFDAAEAGHDVAEIVAPASAEVLYRSLGFRPVRRLLIMAENHGGVPLVRMRKRLPQRLRSAA
jgi:GNAT superfamily N-acetyltransferase